MLKTLESGIYAFKMFQTIQLVLGLSVDCPNAINFARGLNMNLLQTNIMTQIKTDCCTATGVTCTNQRIIEIDWNNLSLNGTINGTAIPSNLTDLFLHLNNIRGLVPNLTGTSVQNLGLAHNTLTGGLPSAFPAGFYELHVDDNLLSGDLPPFPSTMITLFLGYTGFTGNTFTGVLSVYGPIILGINSNLITDIIIPNMAKMQWCDISDNPLLDAPHIASMTMCIQTGLYNSSLLPKTKLTTTALKTTTKLTSKLQITFPLSTAVIKGNSTVIQRASFPDLVEDVILSYSYPSTSSIIPDKTPSSPLLPVDVSLTTLLIIYILLGVFLALVVLVFIAKWYFKPPKINSKFARKNSFGTLMTMQPNFQSSRQKLF